VNEEHEIEIETLQNELENEKKTFNE